MSRALDDEPRTNYSQIEEGSSLHNGSRVFHETFGEGRIIALAGLGDKAKATVEFPKFGRKNLMLKFANLKAL
jgi:DNA helicase-2/ATP-dependent DNA helicase PcrA